MKGSSFVFTTREIVVFFIIYIFGAVLVVFEPEDSPELTLQSFIVWHALLLIFCVSVFAFALRVISRNFNTQTTSGQRKDIGKIIWSGKAHLEKAVILKNILALVICLVMAFYLLIFALVFSDLLMDSIAIVCTFLMMGSLYTALVRPALKTWFMLRTTYYITDKYVLLRCKRLREFSERKIHLKRILSIAYEANKNRVGTIYLNYEGTRGNRFERFLIKTGFRYNYASLFNIYKVENVDKVVMMLRANCNPGTEIINLNVRKK